MAKSFKAAPQIVHPSDQEIDTFVKSGSGKDTQTNTETQISANEEAKKRLTVDMPESLHLRYKVACTQRSIKMNDDIRQFIERRCEELEG